MNAPNFASMSDQELKQYFLAHRDDQAAFEAYMDRRHSQGKRTPIVKANEIDHLSLDEQMRVVGERLKARFGTQADASSDTQQAD